MSADADYPNIYRFYMKLGKLAMEQGDYDEAYANFRRAQAVAPDERDPTFFINVIKRLRDERVEPRPAAKVYRPFKKPRAQIVDEALEAEERRLRVRTVTSEDIRRPAVRKPAAPSRTTPVREAAPRKVAQKEAAPRKAPVPGKIANTVYMDDALWVTQPGTLLRVELRSSVVLGFPYLRSLVAFVTIQHSPLCPCW